MSFSNMLEILQDMKISYIVYDFETKKEEIKIKYIGNGKYHKEASNNKNCLICKGIRNYEDDKYLNAIQKFLEKELKQK